MDQNLVNIRHERSQRDFPHLKLDDDEYVEFALTRAKICLGITWIGAAVAALIIALAFLLVIMGQPMLDTMGRNFLFFILTAIIAAVLIAAIVTTIVFRGNKLYITNKRVMQRVMASPIASSFNIIDLVSVEDASFRQDTITQHLFKYGTLRLSTIGDETTYTFPYCNVSPDDLRSITQLISVAKLKLPKSN